MNVERTSDAPVRAKLIGRVRLIVHARAVLLLSLGIAWLNFLLTSRWAHVPGGLHGWRRPYYVAALAMTSLLALGMRLAPRPIGRALPRIALGAAAGVLAVAFCSWFPFATWTQTPFLDNWPPRFQSTLEGIALLRRGALGGWQWAFLGGYHTVSDITQNLAVLGFVPMSLFGPTFGFHLLHALLFASIPLLVFVDLKDEDRDPALLAAAISCLLVGNFSYMFIRSGDTNSVAGVACTACALVGSHAARRGRRAAGILLLVFGLTLAAYSHIAFLGYAAIYLALESLYYRDRRSALLALVALAIAALASLPLTWELWRYPAYFSPNNLGPDGVAGYEWSALGRKLFYNTEILFRPGRWTNDYTGVTAVFLPVLVFVACHRRSRAGFYAVAGLATVLMLRLNIAQFGYTFLRPMHMYTVFTAAPLAYFIVRHLGRRALAAALVVLIGLYMQITFQHLPHVADVSAFNPALVNHIRSVDGALVLIENSPHRNMNATRGGETEPTPFQVHFESLLPAATGKRFYAGYWDGWQWSSWRTQTMAGGTFQGKAIADTSPAAFEAEMRRWGIRHLLVWSHGAHAYLNANARFVPVWSSGVWTDYEYPDADSRSVVVSAGRGELKDTDWLGARVELEDVRAGDRVVVRTNFYPAWTATSEHRSVDLFAAGGQLAFRAPRSGSYSVVLRYPRRVWLSCLALACAALGLVALTLAARRANASAFSQSTADR